MNIDFVKEGQFQALDYKLYNVNRLLYFIKKNTNNILLTRFDYKRANTMGSVIFSLELIAGGKISLEAFELITTRPRSCRKVMF